MTLLAAFQILLSRSTGQKDIVVGSPIANRHYKEIEDMIGFFVNTLALRTTFDDHQTFVDVLSNVKETTLQAYQYQDIPFEQLVDHLNVSRALNRNPVFQVMFTFQNAQQGESLRLNNLTIIPWQGSYPVAKFDLSFNVYETKDGLGISIDYATDLFEPETIERFGGHFKVLLQAILENPDQPLHTYPLLTPQEKHQLLIEWNDTQASYEEKRIHELFEEQVAKNPHNIALVYEDQSLTYQHLNDKANQLAHHLQSLGVGPDVLVAIAVERSLEMVVGLLSILKAGGAYVPLDPDYPEERLQFMLEDTRASVLMTQSGLKPLFQGYKGCVVTLDEDQPTFMECPKTNLSVCIAPHHLAYVIYTSGSTGRPKGVMVGHESLTDYIKYAQKTYPLSKGRTLLHSPINFDMSVTSIFVPFMFNRSILISSKKFQINILNSVLKRSNSLSFIKLAPTHLKILNHQLSTKNYMQTKRKFSCWWRKSLK